MLECELDDSRLKAMLAIDERSELELQRLVDLMRLFASLPVPPDPYRLYPDYEQLKQVFLKAASGDDADELEEAFLALYCHLAVHSAPYTKAERQRLDQTGGYWCHAGGLSPVLKAGPFITSDTRSADFGAGNGLQGLLFQKLNPHRKVLQIEISGKMVDAGRHLQEWLGIAADRVEWIEGDVLDVSPVGLDFIYLYRPVRPTGLGAKFYERFSSQLSSVDHPVVIFSIADCLREFLPPQFEVFYCDGHLTCFRR